MIAGFIISGDAPKKIVARGIGPSLTADGLPDRLTDPTLDLRDINGERLAFNDDWADDLTQAAAVTAAGLAPKDLKESAMSVELSAGGYTVIVSGSPDSNGIALVEIYTLR